MIMKRKKGATSISILILVVMTLFLTGAALLLFAVKDTTNKQISDARNLEQIYSIEEQANFRTGSWISIEVNGNLVFKAALRPNPDAIEDLVKEAVVSLNDYLFNLSEMIKALEEQKDMKGSGI